MGIVLGGLWGKIPTSEVRGSAIPAKKTEEEKYDF
jgi:hypothetical protein